MIGSFLKWITIGKLFLSKISKKWVWHSLVVFKIYNDIWEENQYHADFWKASTSKTYFFQHIHEHKVSFYLTSKCLISMQPKTRQASKFHRILESVPHEIQLVQILSFCHLVEIDLFSRKKENLRFLSDHLFHCSKLLQNKYINALKIYTDHCKNELLSKIFDKYSSFTKYIYTFPYHSKQFHSSHSDVTLYLIKSNLGI